MDKMREAFEEWQVSEWGSPAPLFIQGSYLLDSVHNDWQIWQAAWSAALAAKDE